MEENEAKVIIIDPYENTDVITDLVFEGKKDVNIKDIEYMCNRILQDEDSCDNCLMNTGKVCPWAILLKNFGSAANLNNGILAWLQEHPPTSYLMDIKDKMPSVDLSNSNIPSFCVQNVYGKNCCKCLIEDTSKFSPEDMMCRRCWRTPMDEEVKKEYINP